MEGLYDNWIEIGTRRMVSFTDLSPGAYTFLVNGSNNDGVWNEKPRAIKVIITPPWWMTWYMYIIYGLVFLSIVYGIYQFQLQRTLAQEEANRLKELDDLKSNLYTNITHEFRTPLSIIIAIARKIKSRLRGSGKKNFREQLDMIIRNGERLVHLITQMLDLTTLESSQMKIHWTYGNVIPYLKYLGESFESLARSKNIHFSVYCESEALQMDYAPDKMLAIVSNILSNAIKHTPGEGKVFFHIKEGSQNGQSYLVMRFRDTGQGIPETELEKIFDKFYQFKSTREQSSVGTGIGLALTKEIVTLLEGSITVRSEYGKGSEFTVSLPVYQKHREAVVERKDSETIPVPVFRNHGIEKLQDTISGDRDAPIVLIIEDNEDLLTYLFHHFNDDYEVALARNGKEGIAKAIEFIPDIIISDVMMPEKDGFEVCEILTRDERTCHIPIILLTAKVTKADRMKGLDTGAIHYLTKPFAEDELDSIIQNLINLRENIHKEFRQRTEDNAYDNKISRREKAFLSKACQVIEAHLNDEKLNPDFLARQLNISSSQLYRKLISITGMSIAIFIRDYRLLQAKKLLHSSDLNVTQVGFEVGFHSLEYFSRCFKEKFGFPPSSLTNQ